MGNKKLALVVHGVGEQLPGETLDALVGAVTKDTVCTIKTEDRFWAENAQSGADQKPDNKTNLFPCAVRRVDVGEDQVVFAEVFWGDISRGASGRVQGLIELFRLVMGLGHLVRENAYSIDSESYWMRLLASKFVWLLHGPITVLNLTLGIGMILMFALDAVFGGKVYNAPVAAVLTACILILLQGILRKEAHSYLFQIFWRWVVYCAGLMIFLTVLIPFILPVLGAELLNSLKWLFLVSCKDGLAVVDCLAPWYAGILLAAVNSAWVVSIVMVFVLGVSQFILDRQNSRDSEKTLYPAICGVMLILWLFFALLLWITGTWFIQKTIGGIAASSDGPASGTITTIDLDAAFAQGVALIVWIWAAFLAFVVSALSAWLSRGKWSKAHKGDPNTKDEVPRMILHDWIRMGTFLGVLTIGVGTVCATISMYQGYDPQAADTGGFVSFFAGASLATVVVGSLFYLGYQKLSEVIGIAKDVVVYFVRHRLKSGREDRHYPKRLQVQDRFVQTFKGMMAAEQPDEVVIVAHSQGTLIALRALRDGGMRKEIGEDKYIEPFLWTMGSPTMHVYAHYFSHQFKMGPKEVDGIKDWVNMYRIDDFVGTKVEIDGLDLPLNIPAETGGHTGYWRDNTILPKMQEYVLQEFLPQPE